jgi:hypothetical protein
VFGLPPLLGDEKLTDYEELFAKISEAVKPADILEEIWICDIADLTWEILRWRRKKANLIDASSVRRLGGPGARVLESYETQPLSQALNQVEQIEHMTAMAETRRNNAMREIERHRATFADARRNIQRIEEGECQVVDAESVEESDPA